MGLILLSCRFHLGIVESGTGGCQSGPTGSGRGWSDSRGSGGPAMTPLRLRPLARDEVRSIDARAAGEVGMPTVILVENAGRGAAAWLRDRIAATTPQATRVLILCGPGNNGGDGGVVARHLEIAGFAVKVVWFADPAKLTGDAAVQWGILARSGIDQTAWQDG